MLREMPQVIEHVQGKLRHVRQICMPVFLSQNVWPTSACLKAAAACLKGLGLCTVCMLFLHRSYLWRDPPCTRAVKLTLVVFSTEGLNKWQWKKNRTREHLEILSSTPFLPKLPDKTLKKKVITYTYITTKLLVRRKP